MKTKEKIPFAQRHPRINLMIGLFLITIFTLVVVLLIRFVFSSIGKGIEQFIAFLKKIMTTTDTVIIVAMITGAVSIIGVVFSSIIAKIVDYRYNVKKYLYDKREVAYEQFISMIYTIMEETKKPMGERMDQSKTEKMVLDFSQKLTLWGSNEVVQKWIKYRKAAASNPNLENLLLLEDIIYEIRKDVGQRKRMGKGDMLAIFINDIEEIVKGSTKK